MYSFAAGIVLYNPNIARLSNNINAIYKKVEIIILVDNASQNIEQIKDLYGSDSKILIVRNDNNMGIAIALNQIMEYCMKKDYNWVLTLDQDSVCPDNLFDEYKKVVQVEKNAIISPVIFDRNKGNISLRKGQNLEFQKIRKCITSGSLINIDIWNLVGRFDEVMFIDEVDFEFCKRIIDAGFHIIRANKVQLLHEIGHIRIHHFLFWNVTVKNHNGLRKYYMARNVMYVANKNYSHLGIGIAYMRVFKIAFVTLLYEKDKKEKLKLIFKGIKDGKKLFNINHK